MATLNLTDREKKLFFENIQSIQKKYDFIYKEYSFQDAEEYKKEAIRKYLHTHKDKLLALRDKLKAR